jgi:iron complex outermembrane receptor protein
MGFLLDSAETRTKAKMGRHTKRLRKGSVGKMHLWGIISSITYGMACASSAHAELQITVTKGTPAPAIDDEFQALEQLSDVPGSAILVDQKEWSDQRAATVKDVTQYIPGVIDQPHDGAESDRLSIRGSGLANTFQGRGLMLLEDGVPITMTDGEFEFPVIDPWLITYAEVFPGANALEYGASTFGGAINFITPTGTTAPGYQFRMEGGSFGTIHAQASVGQTWEQDGVKGDIFAAASGFYQDGFRDQNTQATSRFDGNVGWQASDEFTNRIYINHTHSDAEIPGAITKAQAESDPEVANPLNLANDYQRNLDLTRIADKSAWSDGDNQLDSTVYYSYRELDNPVTTYEFQHGNDLGLREKFTHLMGEDQWLAGINLGYGNEVESRFQNFDATPGAPILTRNLYATTSEMYGEYTKQLVGRLFGIIGSQASYATRDIDQHTPTDSSQDKDYFGFSPRVGLRYDFDLETQAFTNLSRSFEPPTFSELSGGNNPGFNQLAAQRATTAEIGMRGLSDGIHWQAVYYHGWLTNEFVDYKFTSGDTATVNAPRSKRDGIELGANGDMAHDLWRANDSLSFRAAYTYSHFTLDHDPLYGNNTLPGVPEHFLRAETLYHHPSGISFGPNVEWSPEASPIDLTNSEYTDSYAIVGARAYWESEDKNLNIYIEGRNLFDTNYIATSNVVPDASGADGRYFYPGEGRSIFAGFSIKL